MFAGFTVPWYIEAKFGQQLKQQTKDLIRTVTAAGLSALGGHTCTHPILTRVPQDVAQREITEGREILQDKLKMPVNFFCYPNGRASDFDAAHIKMVQDAGFTSAASTVEALCDRETDRYSLPRKNVSGQFTTAALDCKLNGLWWRVG